MADECDICGKEDNLWDAVYEHQPVKVCSHCKTLPEMLLIEKPSQEKLNRVYERYTFSARAKQEIQDRKVASPPTNFRGYTLDELRKTRQEKKAAEAKITEAKSEVASNDSHDEEADFKPKTVKITGLKELKEAFD